MLDTPRSIVYQGRALTALRRPAAILEGPSLVARTLGGEWEGDRRLAGSRDFVDSRPGLCKPRSLLRIFCSHLLTVEWPRGDSTVSILCSGCVSDIESTPVASNCDITCDWLIGGAPPSWGSEEEAGDGGFDGGGSLSSWGSEDTEDGDSSSVNTEASGECNNHQPRH